MQIGSHSPRASTRFANDNAPPSRNLDFSEESTLLKVEFSRLVVACSMVGAATASSFVSIGALTDVEPENLEYLPSQNSSPLQPRIYVIKPSPNPARAAPTFALSVDIPAVHVDISKPEFDALQYWVDDLSQLLERLSGASNNNSYSFAGDSRDTSLIGSRFFAKSRSGSGNLSTSTTESSESVIKVAITEGKESFISELYVTALIKRFVFSVC